MSTSWPDDVDRITITGIRAFGYHGVLDVERSTGQEFVVDVVLGVDTRPAAASDDLRLTVDYAAVAEQVCDIVTGPACNLIETLADRIATALLTHAALRGVEVTVHKPQAPIAVPFDVVTISISRWN